MPPAVPIKEEHVAQVIEIAETKAQGKKSVGSASARSTSANKQMKSTKEEKSDKKQMVTR